MRSHAAWVGLGCSAWLLGCELVEPPKYEHVGSLIEAVRPLPAMATEPPVFEAGVKIEQYDSKAGFFRVHFQRSGRHAVPLEDRTGDGTPDYVNRVADDFDSVLDFYKGLGYREPLRDGDVPGEHGGDDRFDVYLLDFPNAGADGQFRADEGCAAGSSAGCGGYMMLENDFVGRGYPSQDSAIRLVSSHELFHAVQQAYATNIGGWLSEGTAVWASEAFDAAAGDLERQVPPFFERPESSLAEDPSGTDPIRYAGALFFEFIDEHAGRAALRGMWDHIAANGSSDAWTQALDAALREQDSSLAEQFASFAEWNLFTASRADPERAYMHGDAYPELKEREIEPGYKADDVRVFPLAARYYALPAAAAGSVYASSTLPADSGIDDLQLMIAIEHQGRISSVEHAANAKSRELSLAVERDDIAHVVLYNTAAEGGSIRPDLCIATDQTKQQCAPASGQKLADKPAANSGCSALPSDPSTPGASLALLLTAVLMRARRRQATPGQARGNVSPAPISQSRPSWAPERGCSAELKQTVSTISGYAPCMTGPLAKLRVIELAGIGPAPLCCTLLADLGAQVVRIDRLGASASLFAEPRFDLLARGRPSIAIDLKQPAGTEAVLRLCERADVLVEGFRPGVAERLGIGPAHCHARNPRLVYGRMTGWGQTGPLAPAAGHDINYLAISGALHAIGRAGQAPAIPLNLIADFGGGALYLAAGILAALFERQSSGRGQVVDAAMVDGVPHLMSLIYGLFAAGIWRDQRGVNLLDGGAPFYDCYETKDAKFVAIGALEARFFQVLCERIGMPEELRAAQGNPAKWPQLRAAFIDIFRKKTRDEWCAILEGTDACFAPVLSLAEAASHPHNRARRTFVVRDGVTQAAAAPRFDRTPAAEPGSVPKPGEHTAETLTSWGFNQAELEQLRAAKVIE